MTTSERYRVALEGAPEPQREAAPPSRAQGVPRKQAPAHPVDAQCLNAKKIGAYLGSLSGTANGAGANDAFAFSALPDDWTAETFPLILCEFLAYKSALAYRPADAVYRDLLGLDKKGRQYAGAVSHVTFFDTGAQTARIQFGDTQAFAFVQGRVGYLVFRGTESLDDLWTDVNDTPTDETYPLLPALERRIISAPEPARHTGFALAWGSIAPDIEAWVAAVERMGLIDSLVLSGHSLGGALAILGAHHLEGAREARKYRSPVRAVVTFGAPIVGGKAFQEDYETRLGLKDRTLRIEAADDLIVSVTRQWGKYVHVGREWQFKKRPARPFWQMMLLSPLLDPIKQAEPKVERKEQKRREQAAKKNAADGLPTNTELQRTWRQFLIAMAVKALWFIVKRLMRAYAAHSVEYRYGLYLSTLAYQRIRDHHLTHAAHARRSFDNEKIHFGNAFKRANEDLKRHVENVRGRHPRTFRSLKNRPIRVWSDADREKYLKYFEHYIV